MDQRTLKRRLGGYVLEAQSLARDIGRSRTAPARRFVLFGRGRSGSTLLVKMLDANPAIGCLDEVLRFSTLAPVAMVERELGALGREVCGFKLLSYQARDLHGSRQRTALRQWMADPEVRIFHLRRENLLRHALSNVYARARAAYHSTDAQAKKPQRIAVDPNELFSWMRGSRDLLNWEREWLGDLEREEIRYERDLSDPARQAATTERISRSLGVTPIAAAAALRPVTPRDYGAFIENWDTLRPAIAASEFRSYLDRDD